MSNYEISDEQYDMARDLHIDIIPSENKRKLIDVLRDNNYFCSIGANNFKYFREISEEHGLLEANIKKSKILSRYKNDCSLETLYMIKLLWCCV